MLVVEDIPRGTNDEEETFRKITEAPSTTTVKLTEASCGKSVRNNHKKHCYENVVAKNNDFQGTDLIISHSYLIIFVLSSSFSIKT